VNHNTAFQQQAGIVGHIVGHIVGWAEFEERAHVNLQLRLCGVAWKGDRKAQGPEEKLLCKCFKRWMSAVAHSHTAAASAFIEHLGRRHACQGESVAT